MYQYYEHVRGFLRSMRYCYSVFYHWGGENGASGFWHDVFRQVVERGDQGEYYCLDLWENETRAALFIILVKSETAESISLVVFKEILREMFFSMICEKVFQFVLPGVRVGNFLRGTI